jgi:hypothetical protein
VQGLDEPSPRPITPPGVLGGCVLTRDGGFVIARVPEQLAQLYPTTGDGQPRAIPGFDREDSALRFDQDGKGLYVLRSEGAQTRVVRLDLDSGHTRELKVLSPADPTGVSAVHAVLITPDGRSLVYGYRRTLSVLYLVEGLG